MGKRGWSVVGGAVAVAGAALVYRGAPRLKHALAGAVVIGGEEVIALLHPGIYSSVQERARRVNELLGDGRTLPAPSTRGTS